MKTKLEEACSQKTKSISYLINEIGRNKSFIIKNQFDQGKAQVYLRYKNHYEELIKKQKDKLEDNTLSQRCRNRDMKSTILERTAEAKLSISKSKLNSSENMIMKRNLYYSIKKNKEISNLSHIRGDMSMMSHFIKLGKQALLRDRASTNKRQMSLDFDTTNKNRSLQSMITQTETLKTLECKEKSLVGELTKIKEERRKNQTIVANSKYINKGYNFA